MLTDAEKITCRTILGLDIEVYALEQRFTQLLADEETAVRTILTKWDTIKHDVGILSGEYSENPAHTRSLLTDQLVTVLQFNPLPYRSNSLTIGRG